MIIIKIISSILTVTLGYYLFNSISRTNFQNFLNLFRVQLQTMSLINLITLIRDSILNRLPNNNYLITLAGTTGNNLNLLTNTRSKQIFLFLFIIILMFYRLYIIMKRVILWPFKLGLISFFWSLLGVDMSWLLNLFDIFTINIPNWVYYQYLILYNNWIYWWNNVVEVKNLKPNTLSNSESSYLQESDKNDEIENNKWINTKNVLILFGVISLIGVGIWYFYFYNNNIGAGNSGSGNGGGIPLSSDPHPSTTIPDPSTTIQRIVDRVTPPSVLNDAEREYLMDFLNRRRNAGLINRENYEYVRNLILGPVPTYEGPAPSYPETSTISSHSNAEVRDNTTASGSGSNNFTEEFNQYFAPATPTDNTSTGIEASRNTTSLINSSTNSPSNNSQDNNLSADQLREARIESIITRQENNLDSSGISATEIETNSTDLERSGSPTGSNDSSETILAYSNSEGVYRIGILRNS